MSLWFLLQRFSLSINIFIGPIQICHVMYNDYTCSIKVHISISLIPRLSPQKRVERAWGRGYISIGSQCVHLSILCLTYNSKTPPRANRGETSLGNKAPASFMGVSTCNLRSCTARKIVLINMRPVLTCRESQCFQTTGNYWGTFYS